MKLNRAFLAILIGVCFLSFPFSSSGQISTKGLVAWWPFTGNAVDSVKQNNNGTVYGATLSVDRHGDSNSCYYFDGTNDYIDVGTHSSIRLGTHTLTFWFRYSDTSSTMIMVNNFNSNNGEWGAAVAHNASTGLQYNAGSGSSDKNMLHQSFRRYADNKWHMFTGMFDDDRNVLSVYIDNELSGGVNYIAKGHFSSSESLNYKSNEHWIFGAASQYFSSSSHNGPLWYKGYLDDVRFYDRILTPTDVLTLYYEGVTWADSFITVYDTVQYAVYDTTFITTYDTVQVYDTTFVNIYDTIYVWDTTYVKINVYDTIKIWDTTYVNINIYDTIQVWDTTYVTIYDTITHIVYDTTHIQVFDTTFVTIFDTVSVAVTDTLFVDVEWASSSSKFNRAKMYPNPARDKIHIDFGDFIKVAGHKVKIYNSSGQKVFEGTVSNQIMTIDVSNMGADGIYSVHITNSSDAILSVKQLVLH